MPQRLSRKIQVTIVVIATLLLPELAPLHAQTRTNTYSQTRHLLSKMERSPANAALKKLFETGDIRMMDLIAALDDETRISVNSQVIIKYLADPEGLRLLDDWYKKQQKSGKEYSMPKMDLLADPKDLKGDDSDLSKLAMNNKNLFEAARFNSGDVWIRVVARNKKLNVALLEVVQGQILTAGWHSVIRFENNRWRLISDNNVWVT
jgi:hypothetical protein